MCKISRPAARLTPAFAAMTFDLHYPLVATIALHRKNSTLRSWMLGAYVRPKLLVALPFVVLFHFSYRVACGHT